MAWTQWVIDADMSSPGHPFCFCPAEDNKERLDALDRRLDGAVV